MSRRNGLFADESASNESQTETRGVHQAISDKKLAVSPFRRFTGSSSAFVSHFCLKMAFARTTALEFLRRAYEQNRLAHAYLITGPPGSGKEVLAAELASLVNGTPAKDVFSAKAREIFVARPESKSRRISIEQIRGLEHALQMRAASSRRKVAIIPNADRLGDQAANAFLKTLEEPPQDSLLLLLTALPEVLPETILSRCIAISLAPNGEVHSKMEEEKF